MEKFKDYINKKRNVELPYWDSDFASQRNSDDVELPYWDSDFASQRTNKKKKDVKESYTLHHDYHDTDDDYNEEVIHYDEDESELDKIHNHPDVKPKKLTPKHKAAIHRYTQDGQDQINHPGNSKHLNNYLSRGIKLEGRDDDEHEAAHKALHSMFTKDNTNRIAITTYCGVPKHVGEKIKEMKKGDKYSPKRYLSTSTNEDVARGFAKSYKDSRAGEKTHRLKITVNPGHGVSIANHSQIRDENEMLLRPIKLKYSHSSQDEKGNHVHHFETVSR